MALIYKMRAIAVSDSSYIFWTDSEPDLTGANAPEAVVTDTIVVDSVGGTAEGGGASAQMHDLTHSPVVLYNFESGSELVDSSGNGLDLDTEVGTPRYADLISGISMVDLDGSNLRRSSSNDSELNITGAVTVELFAINRNSTGGIAISYQGGDTQFWDARVAATEKYGTGYRKSGGSFVEVASDVTWARGPELQHFAVTRASDGKTYKFYVNGVLKDTEVAANTPQSGTDSAVNIGANRLNAARFNGFVGSIKVVASELSADDIKAEYNRTLGPLLGTI